jgi:hypothetical protein
MLKESIQSPLSTDGFRLIDLLCQSYPTCVVSSSSECLKYLCCVSVVDFVLVLSLCLSTGIRGGAPGWSESTMYVVCTLSIIFTVINTSEDRIVLW